MKKFLILLVLALLPCPSSPKAQNVRYVYVTPVDGAGTDEDPFRSRCEKERLAGRGSIDLRPWGINRYVCASDTLPANLTNVQRLGDSYLDTLTPGRRAALENLVGHAVNGDDIREVLREVLQAKLRAGRDGKIKIYLGEREPMYQQTAWVPFQDGGIVADVTNFASDMLGPPVAWAASYLETFTGTDDITLLGDLSWTEYNEYGWGRTSNAALATGSTTSNDEARTNVDTDTDDQSTQVDVVWNIDTSTLFRCGFVNRKANSDIRQYYNFSVEVSSGVNAYRILYRNAAGSPSVLADSVATPVSPVTLTGISDGTSHTLLADGVVVTGPVTDASHSGATRNGLNYASASGTAADSCQIDNMVIMDYTPPAAASFGPLRRRQS